MIGRRELAAAIGLGVAATLVFWWPLWTGGGPVGGDTYPYFLPQKVYYAERLAAGELPLWHAWTGFGYPLVGESQTGVFYPPNLVLYRLLPAGRAYVVAQLLHYVATFVFTWLLARRLGLGVVGAGFAALVFTYAWFPPRNCLDWAIVTGCWLPAVLWAGESWLATGRRRYVVGGAASLGMQLLAGHYHLAFVTLLTLATYAAARMIWVQREREPVRWRRGAGLAAAVVLGFGLAAVQLVPSWELKTASQRRTGDRTETFDVGYGFIPPAYWTQAVLPAFWYGEQTDRMLASLTRESASATNKVEAHLYFGLVPLALFVFGFVLPRFDVRAYDRRLLVWLVPAGLAFVYTSGWFVPLARRLPGFGFFTGPGRYGIVTTLAVALLAAATLEALVARRSRWTKVVCVLAAIGATAGDLFAVSRVVRYAVLVASPPVEHREESVLRRYLLAQPEPPRLFAPGANLPNLLGVSALPIYLGLGPREYFERLPELPNLSGSGGGDGFVHATPEQVAWLQRAGVTHVLAFAPLALVDWPARLVWSGADAMLSRAWGLPRTTRLFLFELEGGVGRSHVAGEPGATTSVVAHRSNRVSLAVDTPRAGRLVLTELASPGWRVSIDGEPAEPVVVDGWFRGVDVPAGRHEVVWEYRPASVRRGAAISLATLLGLAAFGVFVVRRKGRG